MVFGKNVTKYRVVGGQLDDFILSNARRFFSSKGGPKRVKGLSKCLQKFYLSVRKRDGNFYNKKSLSAKEHRVLRFS